MYTTLLCTTIVVLIFILCLVLLIKTEKAAKYDDITDEEIAYWEQRYIEDEIVKRSLEEQYECLN